MLTAVIHVATGDITDYRFRSVVVVKPFHIAPGFLPPDEIIDPEQWLDIDRPQWDRGLFQQPDSQAMPPCRALVVAAHGSTDKTDCSFAPSQLAFIAGFHVDSPLLYTVDNHLFSETDAIRRTIAGTFHT